MALAKSNHSLTEKKPPCMFSSFGYWRDVSLQGRKLLFNIKYLSCRPRLLWIRVLFDFARKEHARFHTSIFRQPLSPEKEKIEWVPHWKFRDFITRHRHCLESKMGWGSESRLTVYVYANGRMGVFIFRSGFYPEYSRLLDSIFVFQGRWRSFWNLLLAWVSDFYFGDCCLIWILS